MTAVDPSRFPTPLIGTRETPQFEHDSTCCTFLGRTVADGQPYDLYICVGGKTVLARWSSEPSHYTSGLVFVNDIPELGEAYNRAIDRGLIEGTKVNLATCQYPPIKATQT